MPDNEYTSKFKVDISDLKKGIQEANKQMQLANTEFKAASAGMDDWEKSADGISSKLKQLRTVLEAQKSKLNAYNEEQKRMDDAAEENGKRADELRKKLAQLASQGVAKTSEEYKTCKKALEDCEKEQENNKKASDALKVTILNQQAAVNKTEKEIRQYSSKLTDLSTSEKGLTEKLSDQKKELEKLKTEYVDATAKYGKNSNEAKALAKQIKQLSGEIVSEEKSVKSASEAADKFDKSMDDAGDSAKKAGKKASESASLFSKMANVLKNGVASAAKAAVSAFAAYTTAVVSLGSAIGKSGLSTYTDFESQMSAVKALMSASCETTEELEQVTEQLTSKAKELGSTTKFTATEVAQGMEKIALAGWKVNEIIDGIPGVLNLAAADEMNLADACSIVTDYMSAFSWEANRAGEFVDIMAKAMSTSNTTTTELGEAYKNCASTASSFGYTVEEVTAVLATMANQGIKGGEAGTALNAIMTRLATDTKGCATELAEYGVHVYDAQGNMQSLSSILQGVSDVWSGLTDQQQANLAKTIAGTNQYSALQTIMSGLSEDLEGTGKGFADYAEAFEDCEGTAEKMAEIKLDNLKGQLTLLQSSAEGAAIAIGEELAPAATEAVKSVKSILDAFNKGGLDAALKKVSGVVKQIVRAIRYELPKILPDLLGDFNSIFITIFQGIGKIIPDLIRKILPVFVTSFTELTAALIADISETLPKIVDAVASAVPKITQAVLNLLPQIVTLGVQLITSILTGLQKMLPEIIIQIVNMIPQIVSALTEGIPLLLQGAITFLMAIIDAVPEIVKALMSALPQIVDAVVGYLQTGIPMLIEGALTLLMAIIDAIPLLIPFIAESLPAIVTAIVTGLMGCTDAVFLGTLELLKGIIQAVPPLIRMLMPQIVSIVKAIIQALADNIPALMEGGKELFFSLISSWGGIGIELLKLVPALIEGIITGLIAGIGLLVTAIWQLGTAIIEGFREIFGIHSPSAVMRELAAFLVDGIVEGIKNMPSAMWDILRKAYNKVKTWASDLAIKGKEGAKKLFDNVVAEVKGLPDKLFSIGGNIVSGLWNGISGATGWLKEKVSGFATGILDSIKSTLGINSPSRVMRDMVGKFIPEGIAVGINQNAKSAVNSMKNLAAQLIPSLDGLKANMNVSASGANESVGGSGSNIVQNFYQTNNSPKALSRLEHYRQTKNLLDYAKVVMP